MTSQAQLDANPANAQLSSGPKSEVGKAAPAQNSTRHGFRSQAVLLPAAQQSSRHQLAFANHWRSTVTTRFTSLIL